MDEQEANAVFAAAMAASGFTVDLNAVSPVSKNNTRNDFDDSDVSQEKWETAEEEWRKASMEQDEDEEDSLFDDLKSIASRGSKQSTSTTATRQFLVEKDSAIDSSDDDEENEEIVMTTRAVAAMNMKADVYRSDKPKRSKKKLGGKSGNKNYDSESTVATSNRRPQASILTDSAIQVMISDDEDEIDEQVYNHIKSDVNEKINDLPKKQTNRSPLPSSSLLKNPLPSDHRTPQSRSNNAKSDELIYKDSHTKSSGVKKTISPQHSLAVESKDSFEEIMKDKDNDDWANFEEAFSKESHSSKKLTSSPSEASSDDATEEQTSSNPTKVSFAVKEENTAVLNNPSSSYETDYSDNTSLAETVSTLGTDRSYVRYQNSCKLPGISESQEVCNVNENPVGWVFSAMGLVGSSSTDVNQTKNINANNENSKQSTESEPTQGFNPSGPSDQTFTSLKPVSNPAVEQDDSLQAWLGYAADFLFPPAVTSCQNDQAQTEVRSRQIIIIFNYFYSECLRIFLCYFIL